VVTQRADGTWEEERELAGETPSWGGSRRPGGAAVPDRERRVWLSAAGLVARAGGPRDARVGGAHAGVVAAAASAIAGSLREDGGWPSFLVTGWLGAAVLFGQGGFPEAARIPGVLGDRLLDLSPADLASMACALRRLGVDDADLLLVAARDRLAETQRTESSWPSDDGDAFTVHKSWLRSGPAARSPPPPGRRAGGPPQSVGSGGPRTSSASTMVYAYPCSARNRCRCAA
jgi:hypothetical protein